MALHKLTLPVRVPLTIFVVPQAYKLAARTGLLTVCDGMATRLGFGNVFSSSEGAKAD